MSWTPSTTPSPGRSVATSANTTSGIGPSARANAARSGYTTTPNDPASRSIPAKPPSGPTTATPDGPASVPLATGVHSTRNNESRPTVRPSPSASSSAARGRVTNDATDATGRPSTSATPMDTVPCSSYDSRARTVVAPEAYNDTPSQANGRPRSAVPSAKAPACSTASSSAGCTPNPLTSAPSSKATSAKSSAPSRHTARSPWNTGPYANPDS